MAFDPLVLLAFEDELEKRAFIGRLATSVAPKLAPQIGSFLRRGAGGMGVGAGLGTAAGAVVGGGGGAYKGYREAKEQGQSGLAGALGGAGKGAISGATIGAGVGAVGGLAAGGGSAAAAKTLQGLAEAKGPVGSFARFGQRQVHGLTGAVPGGAERGTAEYTRALHKLRMAAGSGEAVKGLSSAKKALETASASNNPKAVEKAIAAVRQAQGRYDIAREAESKGLTSVPGILKSLGSKEGIKDVWRLGVKPRWQSGVMGKAMVALPVAAAAGELARPADQDPEGRGRGERFLGAVGSNVGYMAAPFTSYAGGEALGRGAGAAGRGIGKGIDALVGAVRGKSPKPPLDDLGHNPSAPGVEPGAANEAVPRIYSNAALGKPPEGMML